jgi:hypothetical protein
MKYEPWERHLKPPKNEYGGSDPNPNPPTNSNQRFGFPNPTPLTHTDSKNRNGGSKTTVLPRLLGYSLSFTIHLAQYTILQLIAPLVLVIVHGAWVGVGSI